MLRPAARNLVSLHVLGPPRYFFFFFFLIIIIMYIYYALINVLSTHTISINLNTLFYTHVENSPTKIIYIRHYMEKHMHVCTHTCMHTHIHTYTHTAAALSLIHI